MTRTEDQLRVALRGRAERIAPPTDVFADVEARAKRIHRHRVVAAVGATVAAVVAIAVVVPTVIVGPHHHRTPTVGPSPTESTAPQTPTRPPMPGSQALDAADPWPYRGDPKVEAGLSTFTDAWSARHPGATLKPLFGEIYEPSGQPEIIFVSRDGEVSRWGFAMKTQNGVDFVIDRPLPPATTVLVAAVPGDETLRLLALAAPTVKTFQYSPDGVSYEDMYPIAPGVAVKALEGDPAKDRVRALAGDGTVLYDAPAPDTPAASG